MGQGGTGGARGLVWKIFEIKVPVGHPGDVQPATGQMDTMLGEK